MAPVTRVDAEVRLQYITDLKDKIEADKQQLLQLKAIAADFNSSPLNAAMLSASIDKTTQSLAANKAELKDYISHTRDATDQTSQFETMLNRMAVRLLVLYAVRGAIRFTEDTIANIEALDRLNQTSGVTLQTLQILEANGAAVGMNMQQIGSAVNFFTKSMAEAKTPTIELLNGMGLSFETLLAQNPDERLKQVALAVSQLSDPLEKAKASLLLFGTEGIESVLQRFTDLKESSAGVADSVLKDWEFIVNFWKNAAPSITESVEQVVSELLHLSSASAQLAMGQGAGGLVEWFNHVNEAAALSAGQGVTGFITALIELTKLEEQKHGTDTVLLSDFEIYDKVTRELMTSTAALTQTQKSELDGWSELGIATLEAALKIGITKEQWEAYRKTMMDAFNAQKTEFAVAKTQYESQISSIHALSAQEQKAFSDSKEGLELKISELTQIESLETQALAALLKRDQALITEAENIADVHMRTKALQEIEVEEARQIEEFQKRIHPLQLERIADEEKLAGVTLKEAAAELAAEQANLARFGVKRTSEGNIPLDMANDPVFKASQDLQFAQSQYAAGKIGIEGLVAAENTYADALRNVEIQQDKNNTGLQAGTDQAKNLANTLGTDVPAGAAKAAKAVGDFIGGYLDPATQLAKNFHDAFWNNNQAALPGTGIPTHGTGGPTKAGLAMLHDNEYVIPQQGALVMKSGGGAPIVNVTVHGNVITERELTEAIKQNIMSGASAERQYSSTS
jgi:hypothetical protein